MRLVSRAFPASIAASSAARSRALQHAQLGLAPAGLDALADVEVRIGEGRDLRQMGDADHLGGDAASAAEPLAQSGRVPPADPASTSSKTSNWRVVGSRRARP